MKTGMDHQSKWGRMALSCRAAALAALIATGAHAQCNPDTGPGDSMTSHGPGGGYSIIGKQCSIAGWASGTKCFPMGPAFACASQTIKNGQSIEVSGGVEIGGVGVNVGTTYSSSVAHSCDGANKRCRFWVCYANSKIWKWQCTRTFIVSWDNSYTEFEPGDATVICCCVPHSCFVGDGEEPLETISLVGAEGRRSVNIDLMTHFTPYFPPPPGHPLLGPHFFVPELTKWHFCQLHELTEIASWARGAAMEEIVLFDAAMASHHFQLDADPYPFWEPQLSQSESVVVSPGLGPACFDTKTGLSYASAYARSYDLAAIPGMSGMPVAIHGVVVGIEINSGSDLIGTVNIYTDADGGPPVGVGADLTLITSKSVLIPGTPDLPRLTAAFPAPVMIPPDSTIVVELEVPDHIDGGVFPGCNSTGQSGPTYFRSATCGIPTYTDLATLGFPSSHWVQFVVADPKPALCPADIAPAGGDNTVNVLDMLAVINAWGACGPPCPPFCVGDITQDCVVNVADLLAVINGWGACP